MQEEERRSMADRHPPRPDSNTGGAQCSGQAICPICYEDLKPLLEDLQSISICGHVFHELCLQQWLEYCPAEKGCTCPVCKRSCTPGGITRLYFQSTGCAQPSQQPCPFSAERALSGAEAEVLCGEISKLQGKLSAVGSALDAQKQHVDELNSEILAWKERARREEEMKNEQRKEKELVRQLLQIKEADLSKTSEECARLRERSLALAKELAALKLAMDVNLGMEEIAKLASIGHGTKHADAIDVLQRSLFLRNKSYKELMAQCNLLGRAETRSLKKLEKAEEKIKKLKLCLQELEEALEKKDAEILRGMKNSKGKRDKKADYDAFKQNPDPPCVGGCPLEVQPGNSIKELVDSNQICPALPEKNVHLASVTVQNSAKIYMDASTLKNYVPKAGAFSSEPIEIHQQSNLGLISSSFGACVKKDGRNGLDKNVDGNMLNVINPASARETTVDDDFGPVPLIPVTKQPLVNVSNICFGDPQLPTRFGGTENVNRHAGKWYKRIRTNVAPTMQTSTAGSGSLIAVGADGRGGRIKVLQTHNLDGRAQSLWPKKCKHGTTQGGQTQGCLRIDHFFGKIES